MSRGILLHAPDLLSQLDNPAGYREEKHRRANIKCRMNNTDLRLRDDANACLRMEDFKVDDSDHAEYNRTNDVKQQMHQRGRLGVLLPRQGLTGLQ